jgi:hypothetical protein
LGASAARQVALAVQEDDLQRCHFAFSYDDLATRYLSTRHINEAGYVAHIWKDLRNGMPLASSAA